MALTLSVIAGIALLLPGLFGVLLWNLRARRYAASRPDLPITAVSVLIISVSVSMLAHLAAWCVFFTVHLAFTKIGASITNCVPGLTLLPSLNNPIETMVKLAQSGKFEAIDLLAITVTLILEIAFIGAIIIDDGFDLMLEGVDLGNQGWVYTYIIRPAQNDYRPLAYVLTTLNKDGLGLGFRGVVADIRQSEKGETLAISLSAPERFLYELRAGQTKWYGGKPMAPAFIRHEDEPVGDVVSLDGKTIHNIVISNPQAKRLRELENLLDASGIDEAQRSGHHG